MDYRGLTVSVWLLGVPLVYEAFNWQHGVFLGATVRSEATAAAEYKGNSPSNPDWTFVWI